MKEGHIQILIFKLLEDKDKGGNLETPREKGVPIHEQSSIKITLDFSSDTIEARRQWDDIFKIHKEKYWQLRVLYTEKQFFKKGETETFSDTQKLRQFITSRPVLRKY